MPVLPLPRPKEGVREAMLLSPSCSAEACAADACLMSTLLCLSIIIFIVFIILIVIYLIVFLLIFTARNMKHNDSKKGKH